MLNVLNSQIIVRIIKILTNLKNYKIILNKTKLVKEN